MKNIKRISVALALLLSFVLSASVVSADELPHAFWAINDNYDAAVKAGNNSDIVKYAQQTIDVISQIPQSDQKSDILGSRSYEAAFSSYYLKDYKSALKYFSYYIPFGENRGWADGVKISKDFVTQLTPRLDVYKQTDTEQVYFGARNEPHGVLYGQTSEKTKSDDSMVLLYYEYGDTGAFNWGNVAMKDAREHNKSVELALNFPSEGNTARAVNASDSYLSSLYDFVSQYSDVPVYLRIGAEMNIWGTTCTPDEFKRAFVAIASKMRQLGNVATVWSPSHTSEWNTNMHDYYPGDEYVDWVGLSEYSNKYFMGKKWSGKSVFNEVCFKSGYSAEPVLMVKELVDKYGSKKPIMLSECGVSYQTNGEISETHEDWAKRYFDEMYSLLPMVYPQVKLIAYFNTRVPNEGNFYDLSGSSVLQAEYDRLTKSPWFINGGNKNSANVYFEHQGETINSAGNLVLSTYPRIFGEDTIKVEYYIDGNLKNSVSEPPYTADLGAINGKHTLKVRASGNNGGSEEKTFTLIGVTKKAEKASDFSDTSSLSQAQLSAVDAMMGKGVVTGYEDNTIRPDSGVSRAEFAAMICRLMNYNADKMCSFSDAKDHWASKYIMACVEKGAINGVGDNKFAPDDKVTFEQAVKIVTIVSGIANDSDSYPDGFISKGSAGGLFENLTSTVTGKTLSRIDAMVMMSNSAK